MKNEIKENMELYIGIEVSDEEVNSVIKLAEENKTSYNEAICEYYGD